MIGKPTLRHHRRGRVQLAKMKCATCPTIGCTIVALKDSHLAGWCCVACARRHGWPFIPNLETPCEPLSASASV